MNITDQSDVILIENNGLAIQMTPAELAALRGKDATELRSHFREKLYPKAGKNERKALTAVSKAIDQLPAAIEDFLSSQPS